jgi:Na+-driven multidrug efflux pump
MDSYKLWIFISILILTSLWFAEPSLTNFTSQNTEENIVQVAQNFLNVL